MMKPTLIALALTLGLSAGAQARHWSRSDNERVRETAHALEDAARHVHRSAERLAHHGDWREERALRALHALEARADHFHAQVERRRRNSSHTEGDYQALLAAYWDARQTLDDLHAYRHVNRDFDRVSYLVAQLGWAYEDGGDRHDRGHYRGDRGHERYDYWYRSDDDRYDRPWSQRIIIRSEDDDHDDHD